MGAAHLPPRRHRTDCRFTSERYRRCSCPIYVEGTLGTESIRKALNQTSWEAASELVAAWTASGEVGKVKIEVPPITEAVQKFLDDAEARHLGWQTIKKYRYLLEKRLLPWPKPIYKSQPSRSEPGMHSASSSEHEPPPKRNTFRAPADDLDAAPVPTHAFVLGDDGSIGTPSTASSGSNPLAPQLTPDTPQLIHSSDTPFLRPRR